MARIDEVFVFFSSRRRHTRLVSDWSSDVCSSDLLKGQFDRIASIEMFEAVGEEYWSRSEERRVGKSVDLGGRRIIKKKKIEKEKHKETIKIKKRKKKMSINRKKKY